MRFLVSVTATFCILGTSAIAEPLSFKEARKMLPNGKRVDGQVIEFEFLDEKAKAILKTLIASVPYYGALAVSPDEGLFVEWLQAAGQHHSIDAARASALSHCEANRKPSSAACVVVLEVSPKGARDGASLSLSADGYTAFRGAYRKLKAPKAFAISESQGTFGFAKGDGLRALDACKSSGAGARDCKIVIAD